MKFPSIKFFDTQDYNDFWLKFASKLVASGELVTTNKEYWMSQFDLFCDGNRGPLMHDSTLVLLTDIFRSAKKL